jgi:hypothetical protein
MTISTRTLGAALGLWLAASSMPHALAQPSSSKREPHLPGAVSKAPAWLRPSPFDLDQFFKMPPEVQNAAPLYLEALAEFHDGVIPCLPPGRGPRADVVKKRNKNLLELYKVWQKDPETVGRERVDALLAEFRDGLRKLEVAQGRPQCVFAIGLGIDAPLPHAQAAAVVSRV